MAARPYPMRGGWGAIKQGRVRLSLNFLRHPHWRNLGKTEKFEIHRGTNGSLNIYVKAERKSASGPIVKIGDCTAQTRLKQFHKTLEPISYK